ncbi:trypsin-like peptidase domain-containing protein [Micromonospora echinospora]|uniref:VMAP-C domain-containing protein n=1 Tax=Micromonospora echinospora TaxID=1877 RepID=UPI003A88781D
MSEAVFAWAEDHLTTCLVQVTGRLPGSGFLVAPGTVLTCAHVTGQAESRVGVWWRGVEYTGVVRAASPCPAQAGALWPYPDLAVIDVADLPEHPCVWLTARVPSLGQPCIGAGYSSALPPPLKPAVGLLNLTGRQDFPPGVLLKISREEVSPGMSGGPVLDPATGGVWGVIKAKRDQQAGFVVPLVGLRQLDRSVHRWLWRAHDTYHRRVTGQRHRPEFPADRSLTYVTPLEERELRGILAELPEVSADEHGTAYQQAAGPLARPPSAPQHDYGDVVADLMSLVAPPAGQPSQMLAYAADLARRYGGHRELRDWVLYRAGRMGVVSAVEERLADTVRTGAVSVMVRLRPAGNNHRRFHVTMWRYVDADHVVPVIDDLEAVGLAEAKERVRSNLVRQIRLLTAHERDIMVEFILPQSLLNEPVHEWALWPSRPWETLGSKYAVVVRDLERLEDAESMAFLKQRWKATARQAVRSGLVPVRCDDRRSHGAMYAWLGTIPGLSTMTLPGPPDRAPAQVALEVALPAGVPALAWCTSGCRECPGGTCPGHSFQDGFAVRLADARHDSLPSQVLQLRRAAAAGEKHWSRDLVLLWDDPSRQPPRQQMVPSSEAEVA